MCRYAMYGPYKRHFACFACRKAFKQPAIEDWVASRDQAWVYRELRRRIRGRSEREAEFGVRLDEIETEYQEALRHCPECREPMVDLGLDFKPPPQADEKAWRILQGVYRVGHVFHTCGCHGPGFIPAVAHDYREYLNGHRRDYVERLERVQQETDLSAAARAEASAYWQERIARIDQELQALG